MIRACPRSLIIGLTIAIFAMNFMIAAVSGCASASKISFLNGPFCSVEHTSSPIHAEKSAPEMTLIQELSIAIAAAFLLTRDEKRILQKTLVRFISFLGSIGKRSYERSRSGPILFLKFVPQVFATHGN